MNIDNVGWAFTVCGQVAILKQKHHSLPRIITFSIFRLQGSFLGDACIYRTTCSVDTRNPYIIQRGPGNILQGCNGSATIDSLLYDRETGQHGREPKDSRPMDIDPGAHKCRV
jgi:hypothetical protein